MPPFGPSPIVSETLTSLTASRPERLPGASQSSYILHGISFTRPWYGSTSRNWPAALPPTKG